jgi:predicted RNase H-like HicB family nuclease
MQYKTTVAVWKSDEWYVARCVDSYIASQGKTIEEALSNLREAIELHYEDDVQPENKDIFITSMEVAL